jgi:beta-ribofuranosylaminobenzene 5'-phosphate synthase
MGELVQTSRKRMNANGGNLVTIRTPARLHFALIDLNGSLGRIDGSIGLAINDPHFEIIAEPADQIQIESIQYEERARAILEKLRVKYNFPGIHLQLISEIPPHSGFGSGTQLALGIAQAVNTLYDLDLSVADLAEIVGRGGTSGIGITAFEQGGFILDGGHRFPDQKSSFLPSSAAGNVPAPPLLLRHPFPDWELLIVIPRCTHISGETEIQLFKTLCPQPRSTAEQLSHLILLQLLPAIFEADRHAFGSAINEVQTFGWKKVEIDAQGSILQQTLDFLRDNGAMGAGVSSWGPAIFAVGDDLPILKEKTEMFLQTLPEGGTCFITNANNVGAVVTVF